MKACPLEKKSKAFRMRGFYTMRKDLPDSRWTADEVAFLQEAHHLHQPKGKEAATDWTVL